MNEKHTSALLSYAIHGCEQLARIDSSLEPVVALLRELSFNMDSNDEVMDDERATELTKSSWQEFSGGTSNIPLLFNDKDIDTIEKLVRKFLELASDTNSNNNHLTIVARQYLIPLLSQDIRTNGISWEMGEYIDWYFRDTSADERQAHTSKLLNEWLPVLHNKEVGK